MKELYNKLVDLSNLELETKLVTSHKNLDTAFKDMLNSRGYGEKEWNLYFLIGNNKNVPFKIRHLVNSYWRMRSTYNFTDSINYEYFERTYNSLETSSKNEALKRLQLIELFFRVSGVYLEVKDLKKVEEEIDFVLTENR